MIVIILLGLFAGIKSDAFFKLEFPAFTLALTLLALGVALYILFRDVK
ncbi:MAG: AtpZ/AtpI family protein [Bacteroidetes bacterium]|nr:AtpZ/AtpI family protein [Bacteroidota bacterium]